MYMLNNVNGQYRHMLNQDSYSHVCNELGLSSYLRSSLTFFKVEIIFKWDSLMKIWN